MAKDDHGGREYAVGDVIGARFFKVSKKGRLTGISRTGYAYTPGENIAKCETWSLPSELQPEGFDDLIWPEKQAHLDKWKADHNVFGCKEHGFWGLYADEWMDSSWADDDNLVGIIRAYGEVQIGTKGFRAEKAEIIAMSFEQQGDYWVLSDYAKDKLRRNYPTVVWFDYIGEMMAAHRVAREADFADLPEKESTNANMTTMEES